MVHFSQFEVRDEKVTSVGVSEFVFLEFVFRTAKIKMFNCIMQTIFLFARKFWTFSTKLPDSAI